MKFNTIEEAIEDIKNGKMVVVIDDEDRENEGDLIVAAEKQHRKPLILWQLMPVVLFVCRLLAADWTNLI